MKTGIFKNKTLIIIILALVFIYLFSSYKNTLSSPKYNTFIQHALSLISENTSISKENNFSIITESKREKNISLRLITFINSTSYPNIPQNLSTENTLVINETEFQRYDSIISLKRKFYTLANQRVNSNETRDWNISRYLKLYDRDENISDGYALRKARMITATGFAPIWVYDEQDIYISKNLIVYGMWEPTTISIFNRFFYLFPNHNYVDLGANLGSFCLYVAALDRKFVAVDMNIANLRRLKKSLTENNWSNRGILLHNAVYFQSGMKMFFDENPRFHNIGGLAAYPSTANQSSILSITLNDLAQIIPFNEFLLKIDIEGSEPYAFMAANELFDRYDIPVVVMEWFQIHRNIDHENLIISFLKQRGYDMFDIYMRKRSTSSPTTQIDAIFVKLNSTHHDILYNRFLF